MTTEVQPAEETPVLSLNDKLNSLQDAFVLLDIKYRDGEWWMRGTTKIKAKNLGGSECKEATGADFEACAQKLMERG